jgi:hypothetical protein
MDKIIIFVINNRVIIGYKVSKIIILNKMLIMV